MAWTDVVVDEVRFDANGLVATVVQHAGSAEVLMVGWMNREAFSATKNTGFVHFWSRSRRELWRKGETSGNTLAVVSLAADCDHDTLLVTALPAGPTCHTGNRTCFVAEDTPAPSGFFGLEHLAATIAERARTMPADSYTSHLLSGGPAATGRKVLEEAAEVVQAAGDLARGADSEAHLAEEAADLVYHLLVALAERGVDPSRMMRVLGERGAEPASPKPTSGNLQ